MIDYVAVGKIKVAEDLYNFVNREALPGTGLDVEQFWQDFEQIFVDFTPRNRELLENRQQLQDQIDAWHKENKEFDASAYKTFLEEIGYLEKEVDDFNINVENVDDEIATMAGPQLVVPINNPRYAINAANARWGSLYDALYGTDIISEENGAEKTAGYNPVRGDKVIERSREFLNENTPLASGCHKAATKYEVENGTLKVTLENGDTTTLQDQTQFIGYQGDASEPSSILLQNNGLHIDIQIDGTHPVGKTDKANVKDVVLESALTSIMDCEDSVTAVDAEDKIDVYRNWLGLIRGDLTATFQRGDKTVTRTFNEDRVYTGANGDDVVLSGRVLMLVRNVGHLMENDAVLNEDGTVCYEGILDGIITSLIAKHELIGNAKYTNSKKGSVYIVKPKMHGSEEVAFTNDLFARIEDAIQVERNTLKVGVMDEERRTSLNLKNCIHAVKERAIFINTGFLDRTGDEIHTSMEIGPMLRKQDMKNATWLSSYEKNNVQVGLAAGFQNNAQIGKGMWAMPDMMNDMLDQKIGHVKAGANTAWVPSPTAATLHALHYHEVNVKDVQDNLLHAGTSGNYNDEILQIPVEANPTWTPEEIQSELDNNIQTMLGYVVRWVEQGVGCSKVPDINDVGLMEDRATLRISSQMVANWLHHGITTKEQVLETLQRMAAVVDEQNAGDGLYRNMAPNFDESIAFQAACDLCFEGTKQPNGYTEPILQRRRIEFKEKIGVTHA
ncbi:MAG TPA: malate synthase G [Candidatus Pseudogracilibacillus intestinigallinarum]|uniref:Malate synthase G n=1 Tax=Candidatus Pseudogracilibacillus intestinigallinarum TaxID=2838742 RepID=A0A9D1PLZ7_9BACI|nr:malate synthase G [Candidatus Pseudogracilibacillus intestinigallinarum]